MCGQDHTPEKVGTQRHKAPVHGMEGDHAERTERRAERKEAGEDDSEEDEPVEIPLSAVTMHPKGAPAPASSVKAQVGVVISCWLIKISLTSVRRESGPEQRYDLAANDRSGRQKSRPCARRAR